MSIRLKIILPFLLLTVTVSLIGIYVVTRLVSGSLQERLNNQLFEAGRTVSNSFVQQEGRQIAEGIRISNLNGLIGALENNDRETVLRLVKPSLSSGGAENLIIVSPNGEEIIHLLTDTSGEIIVLTEDTGSSNAPIVAPFLKNQDPEEPPRRALGINLINNEIYYYNSMPISVNGKFYGIIIFGTSVKTLLPAFKQIAFADIVLYGDGGQAISTTLSVDKASLSQLDLPEDQYLDIITISDFLITGSEIELEDYSFAIGYGPLQIENDRIGVFAVLLPSDYVAQFGAANRSTYVTVFTLLMLIVVLIGYFVSRLIIVPLYSLVDTSQAVANGDFSRRTGIRTQDEIGDLATTFDDMTAKLQERTIQLEKSNQILRKIDKSKTNFISIAAHELRTPITLIVGYSQMLGDVVRENKDATQLLEGILEGSERMSDVVERLLDVSRIDSNSLVLKKTELEIALLLEDVQKDFERALIERKIKLKIEDLKGLPRIFADRELIKKVFYHIIMNAIKFTPDGGQITISGEYLKSNTSPCLQVAVTDTGIGIDLDAQELVFEKFNQTGEVLLSSGNKTKFKGGGAGLGLAIARGIISAHDGKVWVESVGHDEEKYPGSTFYIQLPVFDVNKEN